MICSAPSWRRPSAPPAAARSSYDPGARRCAGGDSAIVTLLVSSSRANARLSAATGGQPRGAVKTSLAVAGPRARFVTVTVKRRGSLPPPSTGHSSSSGATPPSKSPGTNRGGPTEIETLHRPRRGGPHVQAVDPHGGVPGVPHRRLDLEPLALRDDPVVGRAVDRHAAGDRHRPLEQRALIGIRRTQEMQRAGQVREHGGGTPRAESGSRRT